MVGQNTKNFIITILFAALSFPISLLASSDVGFVIRKEAFSLSVRIGIGEFDDESSSTRGVEEVINADELLFDCIKWVYSNKKQLGTIKADVVVRWSLADKTFEVEADQMETKPIQYAPGTSSQKLINALEKSLKISPNRKSDPQTVPLYIIKSKEYIDEPWERADITFGAIPGYTFCYNENVYVAILWSLEKQANWVKSLQKNGATAQQVQVTRKYLRNLLGHLE